MMSGEEGEIDYTMPEYEIIECNVKAVTRAQKKLREDPHYMWLMQMMVDVGENEPRYVETYILHESPFSKTVKED